MTAPPPSSYDNPFDTGDITADEAEDDPFAHVAVAVAEPQIQIEVDDPFAENATGVSDAANERAELEELLANTRAVVASLETALERARENERTLAARLGKM